MVLLTASLALALALIHVCVGRLLVLDDVPRSVWLSAAGGVAVSYVFLHILPDLAAHRDTVADSLRLSSQIAELVVFGTALAGLAAFYGLERLAQSSRSPPQQGMNGERIEPNVFWIHVGSFALYNLLIGYLLVQRGETGVASTLVFFAAMATHFVANDVGLRREHKERYDRIGRWMVAFAILAGWLAGELVTLPDVVIALLFALLAGAVVLNVLKEELPENRQSRFLPFVTGALSYSAILGAASLI